MANPRPLILKQVYRFLARMDVTAVLIAILLVLAALGSCFPQLAPTVTGDSERLAQWEAGVRARYGALTGLLAASSAFRCFRSPVFLVPLALLAVATLVCTLNRWRAVWRRTFHRPVRCSDLVFDAASYTARLRFEGFGVSTQPEGLTALPATGLSYLVRRSLEQRGFRVRSEIAAEAIHLRGDRNRLAPVATLVTHLAILLLLLGTALSGRCGWREEVTIGPGETAEVAHGSGLTLRNDGFTIARYPNGSAARYEAEVAIVVGGQEVARGSVRVNQPLSYGPVALHLRGYGGSEGAYSLTLLAVRDPGYGLTIAAGLLLLLGLAVSFNFPHCCVRARVDPGGVLWLAGQAEHRAYSFEREFETLVEELERAVNGSGAGERKTRDRSSFAIRRG
ncbi:MAG: cytochrome c biogenesis protein ResB [Anaerolineae bacterium]